MYLGTVLDEYLRYIYVSSGGLRVKLYIEVYKESQGGR